MQDIVLSCSDCRHAVMLSLMVQEDCDVGSIREALVESISHHLPGIPRDSLPDVAWAAASLQLRDAALVAVLEARAVNDAEHHSFASVCTIVWAFAKLGRCCDQYLAAVNPWLAGLLKHSKVIQPRQVAILLWSFAEMQHKPSQKVCIFQMRCCPIQNAIPTTASLSRLHELPNVMSMNFEEVYHANVQMMARLHRVAIDLLPQQDSQSLSLTLVAFNRLNSSHLSTSLYATW
jgi:hypothetical protein